MVKTEHYKIQSETSKAVALPSTSSSSSSSFSSPLACKKKYRGVRMRSWGSWVSEIRAPNQKARIWLGSYSTAEAAARAYDAALLCLKGSSANLNFPITPSHYIPDTVLSPKSIQRVAAAAANSFADTMINNQNANNSNNTPNTTNRPIPSPPLASSSSPSPSLSSILSSPSTSDQIDDNVSLIQSLGSYIEPISSMLDSWYNFDDQVFTGVNIPIPNFNIAPMMDDFFEGDIRLWSFNE